MTDRRSDSEQPRSGQADEASGSVVDEGTTSELLQDKNLAEDLLRSDSEADESNLNDQPGFDDGRLGGSDGEDREGDPNNASGDSDLGGDEAGGVGTARSGGIDGGPARTHPLPGSKE
ncbi:hypothetical protein [Deinococcus sp.]|uniref:hypothetical protein n=1 Tax=Deinococcus sp. TaxID=47478 RepID=UPI003CC5B0F3